MKVGALRELIEFTCPFCGRRCVYGTTDEPEDVAEEVVSHTIPTCRTYERNEGIDFIQACIREKKKDEPN